MNFARFFLLNMLSFWHQTNWPSFSNPVLLEVLQYNKFIASSSIINEATFGEMLLPWYEKHLSKRSLIKHSCSWHDELVIIMNTEQTSKKVFTHMEVLCLEERDDNFWGIRAMKYLSNNNLAANKETGEILIEIYVT